MAFLSSRSTHTLHLFHTLVMSEQNSCHAENVRAISWVYGRVIHG